MLLAFVYFRIYAYTRKHIYKITDLGFLVFYISNLLSFPVFNIAGYFVAEVVIRTCPGCVNV